MLHPRGRPYFRDNDSGVSWGASSSVRFYKMEETITNPVSVDDDYGDTEFIESPYPSFLSLKRRTWALLDDVHRKKISNTQMGVYINDGEYDVAAKSLCLISTASVNTTTSQRYVSADYMKILYAEYSNIELIELPPTAYGHLMNTASGTPERWMQYGSLLLIDPIPAGTYAITLYIATPPTDVMTANDDTPQIQASCIPLIVQYAYCRCLLQLNRYADASVIYKQYITALDNIRTHILTHIADIVRSTKLADARRT